METPLIEATERPEKLRDGNVDRWVMVELGFEYEGLEDEAKPRASSGFALRQVDMGSVVYLELSIENIHTPSQSQSQLIAIGIGIVKLSIKYCNKVKSNIKKIKF